jgi:hypothetical protein
LRAAAIDDVADAGDVADQSHVMRSGSFCFVFSALDDMLEEIDEVILVEVVVDFPFSLFFELLVNVFWLNKVY